MHSAFRAVVSGRVQMVTYRDFAKKRADALDISGIVKNCDGGTVEVIAEGTQPALDEFIASLREGPVLASVKDVWIEWHAPEGTFDGFSILY